MQRAKREFPPKGQAVSICACCGQGRMDIFHEIESVPANSCVLIPTRVEALSYPRGIISLALCPACGYVANIAFDPALAEYSDRYEGSQSCSSTFDAFHRNLAEQLTQRYRLYDKNIIEIGCGKGEFLRLLCETGGNRGIGFDPSIHREDATPLPGENVTFIKDYYSEKYAGYSADLICCKMTLEHIPTPFDFLSGLRRTIGERIETVVFFQVPDAARIFEQAALEDIYYEHCSYFTKGSLARLLWAGGFHPLRIYSEYGGQYLMIEGAPRVMAGGKSDSFFEEADIGTMRRYVRDFPKKWKVKAETWRSSLTEFQNRGIRAVLWGSGSKASAFLTALGLSETIEYIVDINPRKHGYYMPGTGQKIIPPEFLKGYKPGLVIVMNRVYQHEISLLLHQMGVKTDLMAV
jgi:SAM-dependent methyltransferase